MSQNNVAELDDLSCEVAQHRLQMLAEEGGIRASRSAGSPFVSGMGSCASAIFSRDGLLVAQTLSGLMHVNAVKCMMLAVLEKFPADRMRDGDVFLCNDPFKGGIHPTDLGCFRPIFHEGKVAYFSGMLMVVADMGGMSSGGLPATATEVFHEGLVMPPTLIIDAGTLSDGVISLVLANSRMSRQLRTDIDALVGATAIVSQRMQEMIGRYGKPTLDDIIGQLFDHSEAMVREGVSAIPDGEYFGSYEAQEDGVGPAPFYRVKVRIKIEGSDCSFDFAGTDRQAPGAINSSYSQSLSFVTFALRCYLDPEIAVNEGMYRAFKVELPLGSCVNPAFPAACNIRFSVGQAMVDAIHTALRPVFPDRSIAPSSALVSVNAQSALSSGKVWALLDLLFGPGGGRPGIDANDGHAFPLVGGGGYRTAVEMYETLFPVEYIKLGFVPNTAGPGHWRGGCGVFKDVRFLEDCVLTLRAVDRTKRPPLGVDGGLPGRGGGFWLNPETDKERELPAKATNYPIKAGDVLRLGISGGGGYGNPLIRDPEQVLQDVRQSVVTPAGARADYGVVVTEAGELDLVATEKVRAQAGDKR